MTKFHLEIGSTWKRWDLHLHAPGTKLSDGYGGGSEDNLKRYVAELEASAVQVFGITDYFAFETYFAVKAKYSEIYPEGMKVFIPNIEFRLTETISSDGRNVHSHVLIDPNVATKIKLNTLFNDIQTHITRNSGIRVRCSQLSTGDYDRATVSISELEEALARVFPDKTSYILVTAAGNDGLRGVDTKSSRSISISDELDKASHAIFGSSKNTDYFLNRNRYKDETTADKKPVFSGSDAHSFQDLSRLSGDETGFEPTWIKADTTFRGLRQTLFEPKGRVHIGECPSVLERQKQEATRFILELQVDQVSDYAGSNGSWFKGVVIPFNPELTAIIGNKGSGKSAIADILGLLGESRQHKYFSFLTNVPGNRKFRQKGYAENFKADLKWTSGSKVSKILDSSINELKPEAVKYLPQNFFESLTNEIEVKAFREKIEEVVFSHVDESDRMEKSRFVELVDINTARSKSDISDLKVRLRQLNREIVELERQANPNTITTLTEALNVKNQEYQALKKSKPKKVPKPKQETSEQKLISKKLSELNKLKARIERQSKLAVKQLTTFESDHQKLVSIKEAIMSIEARVETDKEDLRSQCTALGLDIDNILKHETDISSVDLKIDERAAEITKLRIDNNQNFVKDFDFIELLSIPDLRSAHKYISDAIKEHQDTLSAPQRRYQRYIQRLTEIDSKINDLQGDESNPKPDTIRFLERRIDYINKNLQPELGEKHKNREELSRSIFTAKERVRSFYQGLKTSVESRLSSVSSREFQVTIDASFVPSLDFLDTFFQLVNQNVRGPFRGSAEGRSILEQRIADTNWNNVEGVLAFADGIINSIEKGDVEKQVKDIKQLYDELYSFEYFDARYELRLGGKNLNQLSPGEKGLLLLVFYLHLDKEKTPLIIDQPEDNLDNDSIFSVLATCIREAKKTRQVILVTHNPNLAVGADAEEVLYVHLDKSSDYKFSYESGSIENPRINDMIVKVLEGTRPAFVQRRLKYQIS